jgi:peptide/nickel transport system permease protein
MTADAIVTIREGINAWWWLLAPMIAMTLSIASVRWLAAGLPAPPATDSRTSVSGALALGVGVLAVCWLALGGSPALGKAFAHLSATISLVLVAGVLCVVGALAIAALPPLRLGGRIGSVVDAKWRLLCSAPVGAVAGLLLWLFANDVGRIPLLPGAGSYAGLTAATGNWFDSLILPWLALSIVIASFASGRPDRRLDLSARAAGLHKSRIVRRRIRLRAVDLLSLPSRRLSAIVSVALVVEVVFEIPGVGSFAHGSMAAGHSPAVAGAAAIAGLSTVAVLFVLALARLLADPRERR